VRTWSNETFLNPKEREDTRMYPSSSSLRSKVIFVAAVNTAASLVFPLLMWSLGTDSGAALRHDFAISFLYSQVIGTLGQILFHRFWKRASQMKPLGEWISITMFFIAIGTAGAFLSESIELALGWVSLAKFWTRFAEVVKVCAVLTVQFGVARRVYVSLLSRLERTTLELRERELAEQRAMNLVTEARLAALESKVQPHFLFNALNSIASLIQEDPQRAERLLGRLAALLRFSLESHNGGLVALRKEMKIVTDYLEIEQARLGARLKYEVHVPEDLLDIAVPPLSVQTLVENSIKHAIAPVRAGGQVQVSAECLDRFLDIRVTDTGPGVRVDHLPVNHGLSNLQARLVHIFGDQAKLTAASNSGTSTIQITVPRATSHARISG